MGFTDKDWLSEEWIYGTALGGQQGNYDYLKGKLQSGHDHWPSHGGWGGQQVVPATETLMGAEYWGQTFLSGSCGSPPCTTTTFATSATADISEDTHLVVPYWSDGSFINDLRGMQGIGKKWGSGEAEAYFGTLEWISSPATATVQLVVNRISEKGAWVMALCNNSATVS